MKKTFKTVNFIETCGDFYARWSQGSKRPMNAVLLTVTDDSGKEVYADCIRKNNVLINTLADCKRVLNNRYESRNQ